jgi:hypothetical protein
MRRWLLAADTTYHHSGTVLSLPDDHPPPAHGVPLDEQTQADLVQAFRDLIGRAAIDQLAFILKAVYALNAVGIDVFTTAATEELQAAVDKRRATEKSPG